MVLSTLYPKWMGWTIIILGAVAAILVGAVQLFTGPSQFYTNILFPIVASLALIWTLIVGIWVARKAW